MTLDSSLQTLHHLLNITVHSAVLSILPNLSDHHHKIIPEFEFVPLDSEIGQILVSPANVDVFLSLLPLISVISERSIVSGQVGRVFGTFEWKANRSKSEF